MTKRLRLAGIAAAASVLAAAAAAQTAPPPAATRTPAPASADCPARGTELPLPRLFGQWEARIEGTEGVAKVKLNQHPDYAGVRGTITRAVPGKPDSVGQLAGDIDDDGMLSLDESLDGRGISGVWLGELQPASCGRQWKGVWRNAADESLKPFVLDKTGPATP
ncbi:hypothetical protein QTH87_07180 [Variovorax sp. J22P168]|uniref:hypothetical protein n=1 Tax=Variovorax jilinensis TaxID=3053513 RepID=UPI0025772066|nr:hypothetical protein [Variovorax sp. J22P168]MDM0012218.1 hypothetical protein [Variovorax sp. J22P168]